MTPKTHRKSLSKNDRYTFMNQKKRQRKRTQVSGAELGFDSAKKFSGSTVGVVFRASNLDEEDNDEQI